MVKRTETRTEAITPEGTLMTEAQVDVFFASEVAFFSTLM